jgi:hypothetical protein
MSDRKTFAYGLTLLLSVACAEETLAPPVVPGEILGRIEVSAGVPATSCLVLVEGTPLAARCDDGGTFDLKRVPPGRWDLRILPESGDDAVPARRIAAAANPGFVSDLGAIPLAKPGSIGGRINPPLGTNLDVAVIAIPDFGAVTAPSTGGAYLLDEVPPGVHNVTLITTSGTVVQQKIRVLPGRTTIGIDFDLGQLKNMAARVVGRAQRPTSDTSGHGGLKVDLVESQNGTIVKTATTSAEGAFQLEGPAGTYIVRAHDEGNPATAVIPAVVLRSEETLTLSSALILPASQGDQDGDAIANDEDDDLDGDGVDNATDKFPQDPAETTDKDADGLGDRNDLRSEGGTGIDHRVPTPDTDSDGKLDFEDNCPKDANKDQLDSDKDQVGDACDTCPTLANPDQTGLCIQCITNDQCGGQVCTSENRCVDCTDSKQCTEGKSCNPLLGLCVECTQHTDCGPGRSCILGNCVAQCTDDLGCPGGHCVNGACVECRSNVDCSNDLWCDGGRCRPQCIADGDCTGRRTCDPDTKTCVLPCGEAGCADGQICQDNICRSVCDGARPCPDGQLCDFSTSTCKPECLENVDCAAKPHTVCTGGQCVPDGKCRIDTDCPVSQLCTAGTCLNRPTVLDPDLGYRCTGACDCRMGELCDAGHCAPDFVETFDNSGDVEKKVKRLLGTPTRFVAKGGTGDGTNADLPSADLATVLSGAKSGDVIALRDDAAITLSAPVTLPAGPLVVSGGYRACGANRWVRDQGLRTQITTTKTGVFSLPGTGSVPYEDVVLAHLDLVSTDADATKGRTLVQATFAHRLTLRDLSFQMDLPDGSTYLDYVGVQCVSCDDVRFAGLSMPGSTGADYQNVRTVVLDGSSGDIADVSTGFLTYGYTLTSVLVRGTTGPLSIARVTHEGSATTAGGVGIAVHDCGNRNDGSGHPLKIVDSHIGWNMRTTFGNSQGDGEWYGIHVKNCRAATVARNVIDGTGQTGTSIIQERQGIRLENSDGTIADNAVYFPSLSGNVGALHMGYLIQGQRGDVLFTGNTSSGGSAPTLYLLRISDVNVGRVRVVTGVGGKKNVLAVESVTSIGHGLSVANSSGSTNAPAFLVEDAEFRVSGAGGCSQAEAFAISGSIGRIERSRFLTFTAGLMRGGYLNNAELELYSSYLVAGTPAAGCSYRTVGLEIDGTSTVYATGNTLDGGGALTASGISHGLYCANTATGYFTSNLVSGGMSPTHVMHYVPNTTTSNCLKPEFFHNNYFWYPRTGEQSTSYYEDVSTIATFPEGEADLNGNIVGNNVGCYDATLSQPDYRIAATSKCVDAGATSNRRTLNTPITQDIDGKDRTVNAPDIGCYEVK